MPNSLFQYYDVVLSNIDEILDEILEIIKSDKKNSFGKFNLILPVGLGKVKTIDTIKAIETIVTIAAIKAIATYKSHKTKKLYYSLLANSLIFLNCL